jgi:hypothetical protein
VGKEKTIRVYDYVNHPYEAVRAKLSAEALEVFRDATKVAALRAKSVASELHVNFAGVEVGTDISIAAENYDKPRMGSRQSAASFPVYESRTRRLSADGDRNAARSFGKL